MIFTLELGMAKPGILVGKGNHHFLSFIPSLLDTLEVLNLLLIVSLVFYLFFLTLFI